MRGQTWHPDIVIPNRLQFNKNFNASIEQPRLQCIRRQIRSKTFFYNFKRKSNWYCQYCNIWQLGYTLNLITSIPVLRHLATAASH
jgi:hypothetical protein